MFNDTGGYPLIDIRCLDKFNKNKKARESSVSKNGVLYKEVHFFDSQTETCDEKRRSFL